MIWSLVLLVCDGTMCVAMSGPVTKTEEECFASVEENVTFVQDQYGLSEVVSYKCIPWGSEA
jgi:hypothetical protein